MSDYSKMFRLAFVLYKEHSLLSHSKCLYYVVETKYQELTNFTVNAL